MANLSQAYTLLAVTLKQIVRTNPSSGAIKAQNSASARSRRTTSVARGQGILLKHRTVGKAPDQFLVDRLHLYDPTYTDNPIEGEGGGGRGGEPTSITAAKGYVTTTVECVPTSIATAI
jgi:hypothetical protein